MDINRLVTPGKVIWCKTLEDSEILRNFLHINGYKWCDGVSYIEFSNWSEFTCYIPYNGTCMDLFDVMMDGNEYITEFENIKDDFPIYPYMSYELIHKILINE